MSWNALLKWTIGAAFVVCEWKRRCTLWCCSVCGPPGREPPECLHRARSRWQALPELIWRDSLPDASSFVELTPTTPVFSDSSRPHLMRLPILIPALTQMRINCSNPDIIPQVIMNARLVTLESIILNDFWLALFVYSFINYWIVLFIGFLMEWDGGYEFSEV